MIAQPDKLIHFDRTDLGLSTRRELLKFVVRPALTLLDFRPHGQRDLAEYRRAEEQLLMTTQAQESPNFDRVQIGGGPALGIFQMEPATYKDIWENFLDFRPELASKVQGEITARAGVFIGDIPSLLIQFDSFACRMARIQYYRAPEALPPADDIEAMERLYLVRYNGGGKARPGEFISAYERLVAPLFREVTR